MERPASRSWLYWNLANIITFLRLISLAVLVVTKLDPILRLLLVLLMWNTDWLDGLIARLTGNTEGFGKVFDPGVDKFLQISVFFFTIYYKLIEYWIAMVVISGEFIIAISWVYLVILKRKRVAKVKGLKDKTYQIIKEVTNLIEISPFGKMKSASYFLSVCFVVLNAYHSFIGFYVLYIATAISGIIFYIGSLLHYVKDFMKWTEEGEA